MSLHCVQSCCCVSVWMSEARGSCPSFAPHAGHLQVAISGPIFQGFSPSNLADFYLVCGAPAEVRGRHTCHILPPALAAGFYSSRHAHGALKEVRGRHTCHLPPPALAAGLPLTSAARTRGGDRSSGAACDLVSNAGVFLSIRILVCR